MSDTLSDYEREWLESIANHQEWLDNGFKEGTELFDGEGFMEHECGHELVIAEMRDPAVQYREATGAQCLVVCFNCGLFWQTGVKAFSNGTNEAVAPGASKNKNTGERALVKAAQQKYNQ